MIPTDVIRGSRDASRVKEARRIRVELMMNALDTRGSGHNSGMVFEAKIVIIVVATAITPKTIGRRARKLSRS